MYHSTYFHQYPPPTKLVIDRIGRHLLNVPQFYFRVLDLMQNMNLPSPFLDVAPTTIDPAITTAKSDHESAIEKRPGSESELDDDVADNETNRNDGVEGQNNEEPFNSVGKRKLSNGDDRKRLKKILLNAKCHPTTSSKSKPDTDQSNRFNRPAIEINLNSKNSSTSATACSFSTGDFGTFNPNLQNQKSIERPESPPFDFSTCLRLSDIRRGKVKNNEKNYSPGDISMRLYVKNISKKANRDDLRRLFGAFVNSKTLDAFDVCLMSKGKLHGQAFITYANDREAQVALIETNGYLLYEKPIVVMFARSARK